jgi:hypothetical protein
MIRLSLSVFWINTDSEVMHLWEDFNMAKAGALKMEAEDLAWFCEQIALVQKSGIGIHDGVSCSPTALMISVS